MYIRMYLSHLLEFSLLPSEQKQVQHLHPTLYTVQRTDNYTIERFQLNFNQYHEEITFFGDCFDDFSSALRSRPGQAQILNSTARLPNTWLLKVKNTG